MSSLDSNFKIKRSNVFRLKKSLNNKIKISTRSKLVDTPFDDQFDNDLSQQAPLSDFWDDIALQPENNCLVSQGLFDSEGFANQLSRSLSQDTVEEAQCWSLERIQDIIASVQVPLDIIAVVIKSLAQFYKST